jgi:glycosyltransferase involved in cell wall biosynthesis
MKLAAFTKYERNGSSSRLRFLQYVPYLEENNIEVDVFPLFTNEYVDSIGAKKLGSAGFFIFYLKRILFLIRKNKYDVFWIEKELFPWVPFFVEHFFLKRMKKIIVDYDDAVYHRYEKSSNWFLRKLLRNKISKIVRFANVVIVGNRYLESFANNAGAQKCVVIPTVVDLTKYGPRTKKQNSVIIVGWIGSPTTFSYLKPLYDIFKKLEREGSFEFWIIGANEWQLSNLPFKHFKWSENSEAELIKAIDIGIMPLPDLPFERGKCGYKLIQYMACEKAVVASPIGVNCDIIEHNTNGFLASSTSEWEKCLKDLSNSSLLREGLGEKGYKTVKERYSLGLTAPKFINVLNSFKI